MSRAKLDAARELIRERKYFEARAILRTLPNDPTARKWLTKLEEIAPEKKTQPTKWIIAAIGGFGVMLIVLALFIILNGSARNEDSQVAQVPTLMELPTSTPTDTPTPTITPSPTATFTPLPTQTFTPTPSKTPVPSNTPSPTPECSLEVWWESAEPLVVEFLDEAETGGQTARISLSSVILEMRQTQRSFERLEFGGCVESVREAISSGMDQAVNGFNSFLGESEYVAINQLDQATNSFADAYRSLEGDGVFADIRMADTATFIWGGSSPNSVVQGRGRQLAGCSIEAYWNAIEPILTEFSATSASTSIYELYAQMLLFKQLIEAVDYPECFAQGRDYLLAAVDNLILATEAEMDGNSTSSQHYLDLAETSMDLMTQELQRLQRFSSGSNT